MRDRRPLRVWAAAVAIPAASAILAVWPATAGAATAPGPTAPHINRIFSLGGCEVDIRIALATDPVDQPSAVRYEVFANGTLTETVRANTTGSAPGLGNLDTYGRPVPGLQTFTIVALDTRGLVSPPSNAVTRTVGTC